MIINNNGVSTGLTRQEYAQSITLLLLDRAKIQSGSYAGTGNVGSSNPNRLTFNFVPKIVLVWERETGMIPYSNEGWREAMFWVTGQTMSVISGRYMTVSISGSTLSWYTDEANSTYQLNASNRTYNWIAIG